MLIVGFGFSAPAGDSGGRAFEAYGAFDEPLLQTEARLNEELAEEVGIASATSAASVGVEPGDRAAVARAFVDTWARQ
eukprot:4831040-Alexandrium_andersonii.AAC.1